METDLTDVCAVHHIPSMNLIENVCVFPADGAKSVTIQQSPPKIVTTESSVNFSCGHDDKDMNLMLWYQQTSSGRMNLIASSYGNSLSVATEFEGRFEMTRKDQQTGSLVLHNATASDSAVYFCAARAQ